MRARARPRARYRPWWYPVRGGTATRRVAAIGIFWHFMADIGSDIGTIGISVHGFMWFFGFSAGGKIVLFCPLSFFSYLLARVTICNNNHRKKMAEMEMASDNANLEQAQKGQ